MSTAPQHINFLITDSHTQLTWKSRSSWRSAENLVRNDAQT